jgi:carbamoyltransferase
MNGAFLGPSFSSSEAESQLRELGAKFSRKSREEVLELTAKSIASGSAVGWFQGRMEFGPRSLGNRSILADPRSRDTQRELNLKVKYRESFRPFAPSILIDQVSNWFEFQGESAYMLFVADVTARKRIEMTELQKRLFGIDQLNIARSEVPAITHVDYSARLQTVSIATNPLYYQLINKFFSLTGCPMLVNTSFNVRGEPIVCTPGDAFRCFMGTELDLLVIEDIVVHKREQDESLRLDYKTEFELD